MNFYSLSALSLVAGRQEGITNCWCVGVGDLTGALHVLAIQVVTCMVVTTTIQVVSCWLRGCKNRPAPFPGRMSYKATKPGSVCPVS